MMFKNNCFRKLFGRVVTLLAVAIVPALLLACNNGNPVSASPILIASPVSPINTLYESSGSVVITNAGNMVAESLVVGVAENTGLTNLSGCEGQTLAPTESCVVSFNVPESSGAAILIVGYSNGISNIQNDALVFINWYNSRGDFALTTMAAESNPLTLSVGQPKSTIITITNIGGYTLYNIAVPDPVVLSGSAVATVSNNNCVESGVLPINQSCTYTVNVTDNSAESGLQQIRLGFNADYAGIESHTTYNRALLLNYSSNSPG